MRVQETRHGSRDDMEIEDERRIRVDDVDVQHPTVQHQPAGLHI
jgi:hypothetical protein